METDRDVLSMLGRERPLFVSDMERHEAKLNARVRAGSFLVLGGAGSIGQAVVKEIFRRRPKRLHVVDVSENNLVELVRDVRSSHGYIDGDFQALPLDCGELEFEAFFAQSEPYQFVLNLSAMKHVRSEKDAFTLMRMVRSNVFNTARTLEHAIEKGVEKYFSVSSDKAANPANAMGATKRLMELCLLRASGQIEVGSARFANVAFSDGSLLHGFTQRLRKRQPLSAPMDVRRHFMTAGEAATLCLMSCLLGGNREAFFPRLDDDFQPSTFRSIAERFLEHHGYRAHPCATEEEARRRVTELAAGGRWPCHFTASSSTGEKPVEDFVMAGESVASDRFRDVGVILWSEAEDRQGLDRCLRELRRLLHSGRWTREQILNELKALLPEFRHRETGEFLDARM